VLLLFGRIIGSLFIIGAFRSGPVASVAGVMVGDDGVDVSGT
jgi:hypothetical protein